MGKRPGHAQSKLPFLYTPNEMTQEMAHLLHLDHRETRFLPEHLDHAPDNNPFGLTTKPVTMLCATNTSMKHNVQVVTKTSKNHCHHPSASRQHHGSSTYPLLVPGPAFQDKACDAKRRGHANSGPQHNHLWDCWACKRSGMGGGREFPRGIEMNSQSVCGRNHWHS